MDNSASTTLNRKRQPFYGYVVAIATFFIMMVIAGVMYSFGVFFKPVSADFGWDRAVTSGAYSISFIVLGFASLVTGRLNDRFGPRLMLTIGGLSTGAGYILMSQISSAWHLYLSFGVLAAIGVACALIPVMSTIARWFVRRRGLMTGIVMAGVGLGQITVPLVATRLISVYDWRTTFLIIGLTGLVVIVTLAQFLKRDPGQIGQLPDGGDVPKLNGRMPEIKGLTRHEAMRTAPFWIMCIMYFCYEFMLQGTMVHLVPYATDVGISPTSAASVVSVLGAAGIVGRISVGTMGDRIGNKQALAIAFMISVGAFICIQFARELLPLYFFGVLFGFSYGGINAIESPMVGTLFGMKAHGALLGMVHFSAAMGGAVSPILAGRIYDVTNSYQIAFLVTLGLCITGLVLTLILKVPHKDKGLKQV